MSAYVDQHPDHHPRCTIRATTTASAGEGGPSCNCRELRREPLLSEPTQPPEREPWERARDEAYAAAGPDSEKMRPAVQMAIAHAVATGTGWIRLEVVDHDETGDTFDLLVSSPPPWRVGLTSERPLVIHHLPDPPPEGLIARLIERIRDTEKRR